MLCTLCPSADLAEVADPRGPAHLCCRPLRKAVFEHLHKVPESVVQRLVPGVTWDGWHVPVGLELGVVAMMAMLFITIAALEFRKVD